MAQLEGIGGVLRLGQLLDSVLEVIGKGLVVDGERLRVAHEVQSDRAPERGQVRRAGERGPVQRGGDGRVSRVSTWPHRFSVVWLSTGTKWRT